MQCLIFEPAAKKFAQGSVMGWRQGSRALLEVKTTLLLLFADLFKYLLFPIKVIFVGGENNFESVVSRSWTQHGGQGVHHIYLLHLYFLL